MSRPEGFVPGGSVLGLRTVGDPVLRTACDPVGEPGPALVRLVADMFATMAAADGVGLAANQVGVTRRVFVVDCADETGRRHVAHVLDPVLTLGEGTVTEAEGCLSVPGLHYPAPRAARAEVTGTDLAGRPVRLAGGGLLARCLQHETDHLDGRVFLDRLTGDTRRAALRALRAHPPGS